MGHTHSYSKHQGDKNHVGEVWQIDVGAAGNGGVETFVDIVLKPGEVEYNVYNNSGGTFHLAESWSAPANVVPEPSTLALLAMGAFGLLLHARRRRK